MTPTFKQIWEKFIILKMKITWFTRWSMAAVESVAGDNIFENGQIVIKNTKMISPFLISNIWQQLSG